MAPAKKKKRSTWVIPLTVLAAAMTGAEALVTAGIELPGSSQIPAWLRAIAIFFIMGGAFALRLLAQKVADDEAG